VSNRNVVISRRNGPHFENAASMLLIIRFVWTQRSKVEIDRPFGEPREMRGEDAFFDKTNNKPEQT